MWKDFFYYSKSERRAILFLLNIGILLLVYGTWVRAGVEHELVQIDSIRVDSFLIQTYKKRYARDTFPSFKSAYAGKRTPVVLKVFDPNTADSVTFCQLGLPPFLAKRIINYRSKGGVFREVEDFARVYGLTETQFKTLSPYIQISDAYRVRKLKVDTFKYNKVKRDTSFFKYPEGTVVDLNAADTTVLKKVPGIGSGLAKMIIVYRNRLGGFSRVEQLQEVGYVDASVNRWFTVKTGVYRLLKVNRAGLDELRNHPYMNFYRAKVILEYRRKRGKIKGLSQLSMFQEFSEKDLQRLKPYLDFE